MKMTKRMHLTEMRDLLTDKVASSGTIRLISDGDSDYVVTISHLETLVEEYEKFEKEVDEIKTQYNALRSRLEDMTADFYLAI